MLIKYLRMTLAYLMGLIDSKGRERLAQPVVLRGNPKLAQQLTDESPFKDKFTSFTLMEVAGWDAFGGMPEFERFADKAEECLFPGFEKHEYCAVWIRHEREDGKTELNLYVPNTHIPSGTSLKVYYSRVDKRRLYNFTELYSREWGFSCARDPRRRKAASTRKYLPKDKEAAVALVTKGILEKVQAGEIEDRNDVIVHLEELGYKINRSKSFISVEEENGRKLRLRGFLYDPDFSATNRKAEIAEAWQGFCKKDKKSLEHLRSEYEEGLELRRAYLAKRFRKPEPVVPELPSPRQNPISPTITPTQSSHVIRTRESISDRIARIAQTALAFTAKTLQRIIRPTRRPGSQGLNGKRDARRADPLRSDQRRGKIVDQLRPDCHGFGSPPETVLRQRFQKPSDPEDIGKRRHLPDPALGHGNPLPNRDKSQEIDR